MVTVLTTKRRDLRKLLKVIDMSTTLIMVMVLQVYTYIQTHQIVYIKYVQLLVYIKYTSINLF